MDEVRWSWKVTEMGRGTAKDKKGKKGGCTRLYHDKTAFVLQLPNVTTARIAKPHLYRCVINFCYDRFPQRRKGPSRPADLGSAIGLAPQSPGLLGGLRAGTGVS